MPNATLGAAAPHIARHIAPDRAAFLFDQHRQSIFERTDRLFASLMIFQWLAGIAAAWLISPRAWSGLESRTHLHVWAAIGLGAAIISLPVALAFLRPGSVITRHSIAIGQALTSALLIHLTGGRIETHFHVFGSLALLAFYRDWKVLVSASAITAADHFLRGLFWPQSVYGVLAGAQWRWLEHAGWVLFEDVFLIKSCILAVKEMGDIAERQAQLEASEGRLQAILDNSPAVIYIKDDQGRYLLTNRRFDVLSRVTNEQAKGKTDHELFPKEMADLFRMNDRQVLESRGPAEFEERGAQVDGVHTFLSVKFPLFSSSGASYAVCGISTDITERKRAEQRLSAQYAVTRVLSDFTGPAAAHPKVLQTICENLGYVIGKYWVADRESDAICCVESWPDTEHVRRTDGSLGRGLAARVWESGTPAWIADIAEDKDYSPVAIAGIDPLHAAIGIPILTGETLGVLEFFSHEILPPGDELLRALVAIGNQIGLFMERRRAEEALAEERTLLRTVIDNVPDYIFVKDIQSRFVLTNASLVGVLRATTSDEVAGKTDADFFPEEVAARYIADDQRIIRTGEPLLNRHEPVLDGSGDNAWISTTKMPLLNREGVTIGIVGICHDITERKRTEEVLTLAKEESEQANRAKSEFLSRMSHELRTPLNAILGFGQLLEMQDLTARGRESVEQILKGGGHLLQLIDEVLDIARVESGRISLSTEPVPIGQIVQEVIDLVVPLAAKSGVRLGNRIGSNGERYVAADYQRLKQVLLNFMSNAIKYNRDEGAVTISCDEIPLNRVRLSIRDTGLGISPKDIPKLFVPFERLGADDSEVQGTGLGLALSKRLVEAMGGDIGVESVAGKGTTFWVELPSVEGPLQKLRRHIESEPAFPALDSGDVVTMLYIEDNPNNLTLIEHILLHRPRVRLLSAMRGKAGLELARKHRPDVILLDVHLPDLMGDEVLHGLKQDPDTAEIPVVVVSADATPARITRLGAAGAHRYVTKPINVKEFLRALDTVLEERKSIHAR